MYVVYVMRIKYSIIRIFLTFHGIVIEYYEYNSKNLIYLCYFIIQNINFGIFRL